MPEKRLAVVTGAARGIGRAIALELLRQGREVAGLDLNAEQLAEMEEVVDRLDQWDREARDYREAHPVDFIGRPLKEKICERCEQPVLLPAEYGVCERCADMIERGQDPGPY